VDLIKKYAPAAMLAVGPLLAPALGVADVLGALVGIPPGALEIGGLIAVVSGALDGLIGKMLPEHYGLCGGMAWSSLDYWKTGIPINRVNHVPERTTPELTALRNYIWQRLIDSFTAGAAVTTLEWMALLHLINEKVGGGAPELKKRSQQEWEKLKTHLNKGEPWPIVLIGSTTNPSDNHQVLVYGYREKVDGTHVMYLYDNNWPNVDVTITLNFSQSVLEAVESNPSQARGPLKGFFLGNYTVKTPPK